MNKVELISVNDLNLKTVEFKMPKYSHEDYLNCRNASWSKFANYISVKLFPLQTTNN